MDVGAEPDAVLWERVLQHDVRAFGVLHARHVDRVYRHCYGRLGDRADAEEAANQVFILTWRRRSHLRVDGTGLLPWLFAVAGRVCDSVNRSRHRRERLVRRSVPASQQSFVEDGIDDRISAQRHAAALRTAIARLSPANQDVLWLCAVESLTHSQAAAALGVPVGTVKSRLSRAVHRLRHLLAEQGVTEAVVWGGADGG